MAAQAGADSLLASRPDPEVVAKPKRRTFTAEYKLGILEEAEAAAVTRGGIGSSPPPRRFVLVAAGNLAARAGQRHSRGTDFAEARTEVQAPSDG